MNPYEPPPSDPLNDSNPVVETAIGLLYAVAVVALLLLLLAT